jgi:hypothetical protein
MVKFQRGTSHELTMIRQGDRTIDARIVLLKYINYKRDYYLYL